MPVSRRRLAVFLVPLALALVGAGVATLGTGDPTTPYLDGFGNPCRMAYDAHGALYINDVSVDTIYRVAPGGSATAFTGEVPGAAGIAFDAFGNMLAASRADSAVLRISPSGDVSVFAEVYNARSVAVGPDGSVWVSAVDSLHHFDAAGRYLESVDIRTQGATAFGINFGPSGELHFSNFAGLWKLSSGTVVPILTDQPLFNRGFAIDADGRILWARDAEAGDTSRIILYDGDGEVLDDTLVSDVQDPCLVLFVRDTTGAMTHRLLVAQGDGAIVEANADGIPGGGWPAPSLTLADIPATDCGDGAAGDPDALSDDAARFLDAIGNANGGYDVGDFRAYLLAAGLIQADPAPAALGRAGGGGR